MINSSFQIARVAKRKAACAKKEIKALTYVTYHTSRQWLVTTITTGHNQDTTRTQPGHNLNEYQVCKLEEK